MPAPTVRELALRLADDIEAVVDELHIDVRRRTPRKLLCHAPWDERPSPKLEIELSPIRGKWNDWHAGRAGDTLGLVACCLAVKCEPRDKRALADAIQWAKRFYGIEDATFDEEAWRGRLADAETRAKKAAAQAARELSQNRAAAKGLWLAANPLSPADAGWAYLAARNIDLSLLPRLPRAVRFAPAAPWFDPALESREPQHIGPALCSAMTLPDGNLGSLHRTWINPDRPGEKADIAPARKMWPSSEGAAIRLWRGETNLSEREAAAKGVIEDQVLCEGVEDGFSIALMTPELRISAVGSLGGLLSYTPPKFVRRVIVAADNDWGKPQAQDILRRACARFADECGKLVSVARSPEGKDFNDLMRGRVS